MSGGGRAARLRPWRRSTRRPTEGRLRLTSYVWPDQPERLERLRGALAVAAEVPASVEASGAADFLDRLALRDGTTTVVWHSVMWQYLDPDEQARAEQRLDELGSQASDAAGFAHLALEPRRRTPGGKHEFLVTLQSWPGGDERLLGSAAPHGIPTTWECDPYLVQCWSLRRWQPEVVGGG